MSEISKRARRKIYNRVAMMFRRKAKSLGIKNWKWQIKIDGLRFEEYLDKELKAYDPEKAELSVEEQIEEFKRGILGGESDDEPEYMKKKTDYELDPQVLRMWDAESEEEKAEKSREIAREFNENVEEQMRKMICPRCKSSPCRCGDEY